MQQTQERESTSSSKSSVLEQDESLRSSRNQRSRQAVDEARQLLDEIASSGGINSEQSQPTRRPIDWAEVVKKILFSPVFLVVFLLKLVAKPFKWADFALFHEMRKFLAHPGHFFWFNRLAPQAAATQFRTSSTDAMTHHARRFGAHTAMLILAIVVVAFGGFSGLTRQLVSPEMLASPDGTTSYGTLAQLGNMHEIFVTAVNAGTASPRRTKVYEVQSGDSLKALAQRNGVSLETLMYANLLVDPDAGLNIGQKLLIPPTTGMLHIANQGDTIGKLADIYQVDPLTIINYSLNNLTGADIKTQLAVGQEVIVPNGIMPPRDTIFVYTIKAEDSVKSVAEKFGISTYTLRIANDLDNSDNLTPGDELQVLPISGIQYTIRPGDTLQGIATRYSVPVESIINYPPNNVAKNVKLEANRSIIIPNGIIPVVIATPTPVPARPAPAQPQQPARPANQQPAPAQAVAPKPAQPAAPAQKPAQAAAPKPAVPAVAPKPAQAAAPKPAVPAAVAPKPAVAQGSGLASGSMIWPMRGLITTYFGQRIWYGIHMGLDVAAGCGAPIIAADGGTVIEAGWSPYGYGINVQIDHGGGIVTRYGHMSRVIAVNGQRVSKGQLIGLEGTTGNSTGCHLHFEVKVGGNYQNPLGWIR